MANARIGLPMAREMIYVTAVELGVINATAATVAQIPEGTYIVVTNRANPGTTAAPKVYLRGCGNVADPDTAILPASAALMPLIGTNV